MPHSSLLPHAPAQAFLLNAVHAREKAALGDQLVAGAFFKQFASL
jgi:hypothetical protein